MLISTFLIAIYYVFTKYVFLTNDFINNFILIRIGTLFGSLSLLTIKKYRREFIFTFFKSKNKIKFLMVANPALNLFAIALISYAIMLGPVSLVNSFEGIQSFFTLVIMIFISIKFPRVLREEVDKRTTFYKLLALALIIVGIYFINI